MDNINDEKVVLYSSNEAAKMVTVTGWVSRDGRFFGNDEHLARWSGCTHLLCSCGNKMERSYTMCEKCRQKLEIERYSSLPFKEWDGITPLYSHACDKYFFSPDELEEYCEEEEVECKDLRLVICSPNCYKQVESDYWEDIMPDDSDGDIPKELQEALNQLNAVIKTLAPASWEPGNTRTEYTLQT